MRSKLTDWQRTMYRAITRPLGARSPVHADAYVKPSATLRPGERVDIYNRMYWYRLLDCVADDHPGLRALLGERKFWALTHAYLHKNPSRSFTLRNLCSRMARFIAEEPNLTAPHTKAALDIARFEWAQIVAFDGPALPKLTAEDIATADPMSLRVGLQPYLSLLSLDHAVDDYIVAVKRDDALRSEASNAVTHGADKPKIKRLPPPKRERIHLAVHRLDNDLYYKRLAPDAIRLLRALGSGKPLADACATAFAHSRETPEEQAAKVQAWCSLWIQLGWIAQRPARE
ncbi:MAG TPA: DNA-binding domain-containing protein [Chthoniobacterales bacterium]